MFRDTHTYTIYIKSGRVCVIRNEGWLFITTAINIRMLCVATQIYNIMQTFKFSLLHFIYTSPLLSFGDHDGLCCLLCAHIANNCARVKGRVSDTTRGSPQFICAASIWRWCTRISESISLHCAYAIYKCTHNRRDILFETYA